MASSPISFDADRIAVLLETIERMAAGDVAARLPITPRHDALDAIAYAINVLVAELGWASARAKAAQEARTAELQAAVDSAEARNTAMLRAIPDLMFVNRRDGTFLDFHARDPGHLLVPPDVFMGRTVRDILPPAVAEAIMQGFERACAGSDLAVVEYELPVSDKRFFEARIVRLGADRLLTIVRDITDSKQAQELNRDLARRLIARQELERQRIGRELHDDVSQRIAVLATALGQLASQAPSEHLSARLREIASQAGEVAADVHHISYELHPSRVQILGLVGAVQALCWDMSQHRNLRVEFAPGDVPPAVDANLSLCLYRIAQEALRNVVRHSQATEARVAISAHEGFIELEIADDGVGFDPAQVLPRGLGLVSMRERAAGLSGQLVIDARPGTGTRIVVRMPLVAAAENPSPLASS